MPDDVNPPSEVEISAPPLHEIPKLVTRDVYSQSDSFERLLDVLVGFGKVVISVFSAGIVTWGIHANGNFNSLGEPWAMICAASLGVCIQVGVMAGFYRVFTNTGINAWSDFFVWLLRALPILIIVTACITFEAFHSLAVQMKGSTGEQLELRLSNELQRMQAQITALDELISGAYDTQVKAHLKLADDAAHGRDDSGIRKAGPRYQEQMRRYAEITSRFGSLAARIPAAIASRDVNAIYQNTHARLIALTGKRQDLQSLFTDVEGKPMPASIAIAFDHTRSELKNVEGFMNQLRHASPQTLAIQSTFEFVENALHGRVEHKQDLFALAYAVAPITVLVLLFLYSGLGGNANRLRREHRQRKKELDLLRKLGKTETEIWGATESWFSIRDLNEKWRRLFHRE